VDKGGAQKIQALQPDGGLRRGLSVRCCKAVFASLFETMCGARSYVQNKVGSYVGNYPRQYFS